MLFLCTAILTPEQLANLHVSCYPYFPVMDALVDALKRRRPGDAAA
jgi:hypothetical protein